MAFRVDVKKKVEKSLDNLPSDVQAKLWTLVNAMRRLGTKQPVIQRDHGPDKRFLFAISPGDTLRLANPGTWPELLHVRTVSQSQSGGIEIAGVALTDARKKADIIAAKQWYRIRSMSTLQSLQPSVVTVLPDGTVQPAGNDA